MELQAKSRGTLKVLAKRKSKNHELADLLLMSGKINEKQYRRIQFCCDIVAHIKEQGKDQKLELLYAWTCGNRLCPVCSKSKTSKLIKAHEKLLTRLHTDYPKKFKFIFLTLTVKNCKGSELRDTIKQMTTAFNKMSRYKAFDTIAKGYIRRVEVTYNDKRDDYHPHIHALLAVPSQYKRSKKGYVNQKEWRDLWAKAMKLDYDPNVDIRLVRNARKINEDNTTNGTNKMLVPGFAAVQEISKYQVKPIEVDENLSDLLRSKIYGTLHEALKGVRAVTYGGILKELALKILEEEKAELENTDLSKDTAEQVAYDLIRSEYIGSTKEYSPVTSEVITLSKNPRYANKKRAELIKQEAKTSVRKLAQKMHADPLKTDRFLRQR